MTLRDKIVEEALCTMSVEKAYIQIGYMLAKTPANGEEITVPEIIKIVKNIHNQK